MQSILNQQQPGLKKFITASVILHIIILLIGLFFLKTESSRMLFAPVYTTVELVAAPRGRGPVKTRPAKRRAKKSSPIESTAKKRIAKKTIIKKRVVVKKPSATKKVILPDAAKAEKPIKETTPPPPVKEVDTVSSAIAALEKKVADREDDELIARRIKEIEERKLKEEENVAEEVAGLREEILRGGISVDSLTSDTPSPGASSSKVNISQLDIAFIEYYNSVGSMIRTEWVFPGDAVSGLHAIIAIKIAPDGRLLALRVERDSGNTLFDQSAIKAVEKVGDFPPLPKEIKEEFLEIGVRFCPGGCKQK